MNAAVLLVAVLDLAWQAAWRILLVAVLVMAALCLASVVFPLNLTLADGVACP